MGKSTGCVYVCFDSVSAVEHALMLNGVKLRNREIKVSPKRTNIRGVTKKNNPYNLQDNPALNLILLNKYRTPMWCCIYLFFIFVWLGKNRVSIILLICSKSQLSVRLMHIPKTSPPSLKSDLCVQTPSSLTLKTFLSAATPIIITA